jgi:prepilin-type N-terminal cleavage/methylation domain-containing protein
MLIRRNGFTLVEMVVSLTLTGIVLSLVSAIALRQQRLVDDLAEQRAVSSRLREASSLLPIQLRAASASDIREASDTSLELRATIANAIVCDTLSSRLVLAPATDDDPRVASFIAPIEAGDSIWLLSNDGLEAVWRGARVTDVGLHVPGACHLLGPQLSSAGLHASRVTVTLASLPPTPIGLPVRVTRPVRYSLYHASDGDWYVGQRDWNNALSRFNTIQPIVGPFLKATSAGLVFRYADTSGASLTVPVTNREGIARIDVELRAETKSAMRAFAPASITGKHMDSTLLSVALRSRP